MGVRQSLSGGAEAWDLSTTCGPSQESVIPLLLSLSPGAWAGNTLISFSPALKYSCQSCRQSYTQLSDETNSKMHYRLARPMMRSYRVGGEWEGEKEPERSWWTVGDASSQQPIRGKSGCIQRRGRVAWTETGVWRLSGGWQFSWSWSSCCD